MATTNSINSTTPTSKQQQHQLQQDDDDDTDKIPLICQYWLSWYRSLPPLLLFGVNMSMLLSSAFFLTAVRFGSEYIMSRYFYWPSNEFITAEASSSVAATVHSSLLVPGLLACFTTQPYSPSARLQDAPIWWQDCVIALLQFCTGYMIYDSIVNIFWLKAPDWNATDLMFLGHHMATALYMTSARYYQAGHMSAMMCMLLGECTNPLHNGYYIAKSAITVFSNNQTVLLLHNIIECGFCILYCLLRVCIGPIACLHISLDLFWNKNWKQQQQTDNNNNSVKKYHNLPLWLLLIWSILMWGVVFGSIPWIQECWTILRTKYYLPIHSEL